MYICCVFFKKNDEIYTISHYNYVNRKHFRCRKNIVKKNKKLIYIEWRFRWYSSLMISYCMVLLHVAMLSVPAKVPTVYLLNIISVYRIYRLHKTINYPLYYFLYITLSYYNHLVWKGKNDRGMNLVLWNHNILYFEHS